MTPTTLLTARLRLRPLDVGDLEEMKALVADACVRRFLFENQTLAGDEVRDMLETGTRDFDEAGIGLWGMHLADDDALIGFFQLWPPHIVWPLHDDQATECSFALHSRYRGQGYAYEAGIAMIDHVRSLGLNVLRASTDVCNGPCIRMLSRLDFTESAVVSGPLGPLRVFKLAL